MAYLALTGRLRAAAVAAGTFAVTVAAGFGGLPGPSRTFWLGGAFYDQNRIGDPANPSDQSLSGAVSRLAGTGDPPRLWWLVAVLAVGLAGLAVAVWAHRRGYRMAGFGCCAVTGLLVSPISWTHHWVWAVPLLVWLIAAACRRRSAAWVLAAVTAAVVFSDYTPLPWPGHPADPARMVASDLYVLFGLAMLAAVGVALARSQRIRPGRRPPGSPRYEAASIARNSVRAGGFEPPRCRHQQDLNLPRMPFRHARWGPARGWPFVTVPLRRRPRPAGGRRDRWP